MTTASEPERDHRVARRARRQAAVNSRAAQREDRWNNFRFAVPYRTEGPKISLGILWFATVLGAAWVAGILTIIPVSVAVTVGGFQVGHAWVTDPAAGRSAHRVGNIVSVPTFRFLAAVLALLTALGGWGGAFGLGMATIVTTLLALLTGAWFGGGIGLDRAIEIGALLVRCAIPVGVAGGAIVAVAVAEPRAFVVMLALVSAYEAADFLVGTGSPNAVEGPIAGLVSVAVAGFALRLIPPEPLTQDSLTAFAVLTALCCVVGQLLASAVLPRGGAYAPGLRRLDSAMLTAPLWLVLLPLLADA
ncbi:MAG: hypothetical protein HKN24_14895 [Acidimicrobiales bacterium]|nr:hypothetical protein [Acidimicrobiales bacterium]